MQSNEHLTRQLDIIPLSILGEPITIIGAGAIGSWTCLALAKMGFSNLRVFDHDRVDTVNLNSQFYPIKAVGHFKAESLKGMVHEFTGTMIDATNAKYEGGKFAGIVISAVDSMQVRQLIWEEQLNGPCRAVIDPRMGAESALLYVMRPANGQDMISYPKSLYSDSGAVQEPCTAKATIYTANLLSGLVCKAVKDLLTRPDYLRMVQWDIAANDAHFEMKRIPPPDSL